MQIKKNPRSRLENFSKIFLEIGLVLALFMVYQVLEIKTYDVDYKDMGTVNMTNDLKEDIPIIKRKELKIEKASPPPVAEKISVVKNDIKIEETILDVTETDENEAVRIIEPRDISEVEEIEEIVEDVPFMVLEDTPIFPGCKGNKKELKNCFTESIKLFFSKNFDTNLAQELGLEPGNKRIFVLFKIDRTGNVVDVKARAPHPILQEKVIKIISSLPQMTPGKQRGKAVSVRYSLPILFNVIDQ